MHGISIDVDEIRFTINEHWFVNDLWLDMDLELKGLD